MCYPVETSSKIMEKVSSGNSIHIAKTGVSFFCLYTCLRSQFKHKDVVPKRLVSPQDHSRARRASSQVHIIARCPLPVETWSGCSSQWERGLGVPVSGNVVWVFQSVETWSGCSSQWKRGLGVPVSGNVVWVFQSVETWSGCSSQWKRGLGVTWSGCYMVWVLRGLGVTWSGCSSQWKCGLGVPVSGNVVWVFQSVETWSGCYVVWVFQSVETWSGCSSQLKCGLGVPVGRLSSVVKYKRYRSHPAFARARIQ